MSKPRIIGLTGSIGMGKTTVARMLRSMGLPVHSADEAVHKELSRGGKAVKPVAKRFPQTLKRGRIDRRLLAKQVLASPRELRELEKILHPLVRKSEQKFITEAGKKKSKAAVLEIPLLFETKAEKRCDVTLCVTAPRAVQRERVLKRPGMTKEKFRAILKRQLPDAEKRRRADYIITSKTLAETERRLKKLLTKLISGH